MRRSGAGGGYGFDIIKDIINRSDPHGLFFFFPGQGETEKNLYLPKKLNGINAVKAMVIPQIIGKTRVLELEVFAQNSQDFFL